MAADVAPAWMEIYWQFPTEHVMAAMWPLVVLICSNCCPENVASFEFFILKIFIQAYPLGRFYYNNHSSLESGPFHLFFLESGISGFYDRTMADSSPTLNYRPDQRSIHSPRSNSDSQFNTLTRLQLTSESQPLQISLYRSYPTAHGSRYQPARPT